MRTLLVLLLLLMKYVKSLELSDFTVDDGAGEAFSFAKLRHVPVRLRRRVTSSLPVCRVDGWGVKSIPTMRGHDIDVASRLHFVYDG